MLANFGEVHAANGHAGAPGTLCHSLLATLLHCQRAARSLLKYLTAAAAVTVAGEATATAAAAAAAGVPAAGEATAAAVTAAGEATAGAAGEATAAGAAAAGKATAGAVTATGEAAAAAAGNAQAHGPAPSGVPAVKTGASSGCGGAQLLQLPVEGGCSQQQEQDLERLQHQQQDRGAPTAVAAAAAAVGGCELPCMDLSSAQRVTGLQLAVSGSSALGELVQQQLQVSLSDLEVMVGEVLRHPAAKEMSSEQVNELLEMEAAAGPGRGDTFRPAAAAAGVLRR